MQPVVPKVNCACCKEALSSAQNDAERDCLSIEAYRKGNCAAAFAPEEPLWAFKRSAGSPEEVTSESELRRRFNSGELDASVLVRSASQDNYTKADACLEFGDVTRLHPAPETADPLWEFKTASRGRTQTVKQSELIQLFVSGSLYAETLVRKKRPGSFVRARECPLFASLARPRTTPPSPSPARTLVPPAISPGPVPAPTPVLRSPAAATSPSAPPGYMGFTWSPKLIGIVSFFLTGLIGFILAKCGFLRSTDLNMTGTFLPTALIPFVLYCLAHGARGNTRLFGKAAIVGGVLWVCIALPIASVLGLADSYESKVQLGASVCVLPLIAGLTGNGLAQFAAKRPHSMSWGIPLIYIASSFAAFLVVFAILEPIDYGRKRTVVEFTSSPTSFTVVEHGLEGNIVLGVTPFTLTGQPLGQRKFSALWQGQQCDYEETLKDVPTNRIDLTWTNYGWLEVNSDPTNGNVYCLTGQEGNGVYDSGDYTYHPPTDLLGVTPLRIPLPVGKFSLAIRKDLYFSTNITATISESSGVNKFDFILQPLPHLFYARYNTLCDKYVFYGGTYDQQQTIDCRVVYRFNSGKERSIGLSWSDINKKEHFELLNISYTPKAISIRLLDNSVVDALYGRETPIGQAYTATLIYPADGLRFENCLQGDNISIDNKKFTIRSITADSATLVDENQNVIACASGGDDVGVGLQTTAINLMSSDNRASFRLIGPEMLECKGSCTFSNVLSGTYKIIAAEDGFECESKVEAMNGKVNSVEYMWRTLNIRVETAESLHIYLGNHVVGEKTATIRVPLGKAEIVLRGKGTTKVRSYEDGGWSDYETYELEFYEELPLKLKAEDHVAHYSGSLGLVGHSMPSKARPYEVFVEQEDER
jgi:hypothetical protein